jgi:[acyl-carrier-protein] S-malonyltransferase
MSEENKIYMFPGQGSQEIGMGRELLSENIVAAQTFNAAETILKKRGWNQNLRDICLSGPLEVLNDTEIAQPALLTVSLASYFTLKESGAVPCGVVGHSLGEYSALGAAESIEFSTLVDFVAERGRQMNKAAQKRPGGMAAVVGMSMCDVQKLCQRLEEQIPDSTVEISNVNTPHQIVISGDKEAIVSASDFAAELGARKIVILPVSIAAHSSLMAPVADELAYLLASVDIKDPKVHFYSSSTTHQETTATKIRQMLVAQLTGRVLWLETIKNIISEGNTSFLEIGPKSVLTQLIKQIDKGIFTESQSL